MALFGLVGCAPMYVPSAVHVPLLREAGDVHVSVHGGTNGVQLNSAVALTDGIGLRASAQGFAYDNQGSGVNGRYLSIGGGPTFFYGGGAEEAMESGLRASASVELHGGSSAGVGQIRVTLPEQTLNRYSGWVLRPTLQADVGYEWEYFAIGLAGRFSLFYYSYDASSDFPSQTAMLTSVEPVAFARLGTGAFKFELQAGVMVPLTAEGEMGFPLPMMISGGFVLDL